MKPTLLFALLSLTCITLTSRVSWAQGSHQSGSYSVEVLMNGAAQPVYVSGSRSFVAGAYGAAYQIRVNNHSARRIEAVIAVDGRDVVSGQPVSPRRQRGYIVQPYSSTTISGFRSTTESVATFRFSTIPESYAWQTGTSWDLGAIRVWVFEEEPPPVVYYPPVMPYGGAQARRSAPSASAGDAEAAAPQSMGTAYGEQRWSPVNYTTFTRRTRRPNAVVGIRYNSYQMLAAAGIIQSAPVYPVCYGTYCGGAGPFAPPPPGYNPTSYGW